MWCRKGEKFEGDERRGFSTEKRVIAGKNVHWKVADEVVCCFLVVGEDERSSLEKIKFRENNSSLNDKNMFLASISTIKDNDSFF